MKGENDYMENNKIIKDETIKNLVRSYLDIDPDYELMDARVDFVFKRIFTADDIQSKSALIAFINSVMEFENDEKIVEVLDLKVVNAEIPVNKKTQKKSVFDIRAKDVRGRQIIVEMQKDSTPGFRKRSQHIISKAYASQEISGSDYDRLEKCYLICITNFDMIAGTEEYITDYRYRDREGRDLSDDETIVFLDLSKIGVVG